MAPWNNPQRKIKFVKTVCRYCGYEQIMFTCASRRVKCFGCGEILAVPKGGKCKLIGGRVIGNLR